MWSGHSGPVLRVYWVLVSAMSASVNTWICLENYYFQSYIFYSYLKKSIDILP
jgi:hypothetical protein